MDKYNQKIASLHANAQKKFAQGMKAFGEGYPAPPLDTPERYGWEAAEAIALVRKKAMADMYDALESEISELESEY